MNTINLNRREVKQLHELFELLNESGDCGCVTLATVRDNAIGNVLTATFGVTHKEVHGEFTVTLSDYPN